MSKVFNFLWYKVLSTQISYSYMENYDRKLENKNLLVLYKEKIEPKLGSYVKMYAH